jgi:hypothetical protein
MLVDLRQYLRFFFIVVVIFVPDTTPLSFWCLKNNFGYGTRI